MKYLFNVSPASETTAESNSSQMADTHLILHQLCFLADAGITEVSSREGEDVTLPCGLDSPVNLTDQAFDWKKEQQEVFFYDQGSHYNNGRGGQDPQFVGRVSLLPGGLEVGNVSVILSSVTQRDGGLYQCIILPAEIQRVIQLTVGE